VLLILTASERDRDVPQLLNKHSHYGLSPESFELVKESVIHPASLGSKPGELGINMHAPRYSVGAAAVIHDMCKDGTISKLEDGQITWVMISNYSNTGATLDATILRQLSKTSHDAVVEVVPLSEHGELTNVILEPPHVPMMTVCHRARLKSPKVGGLLGSARHGATGTHWVRVTAILKRFGVVKRGSAISLEKEQVASIWRSVPDGELAQRTMMELFEGMSICAYPVSGDAASECASVNQSVMRAAAFWRREGARVKVTGDQERCVRQCPRKVVC
jgi:hypothetical protein